MAREVVVKSDLSGEPGARTYTIQYDGQRFEVDLTDEEAEPILKLAEHGRATEVSPRSTGRAQRDLAKRIRNAPQPPEED